MFDAIDFKWNDEDNAIKASIPLISEEELRIIDNNFGDIVNQFIKQFIKNKDIAIAQHIIQRQQAEIEKRNKIINNAITEIETLRTYFSEDLQPDFIRILEILKDKKVIDW